MLILGGIALRRRGLELAARIAAATGCKLSNSGYSARMERGGGLPHVGRIPFVVDQAVAYLKDVHELVLIGARRPVAFLPIPESRASSPRRTATSSRSATWKPT